MGITQRQTLSGIIGSDSIEDALANLRAVGYRTTEHVSTERATHVVLAR
jgi:hypothetical protein